VTLVDPELHNGHYIMDTRQLNHGRAVLLLVAELLVIWLHDSITQTGILFSEIVTCSLDVDSTRNVKSSFLWYSNSDSRV